MCCCILIKAIYHLFISNVYILNSDLLFFFKIILIAVICAILGFEIFSALPEESEMDFSNEELEKIEFSIDFENFFSNASDINDEM